MLGDNLNQTSQVGPD